MAPDSRTSIASAGRDTIYIAQPTSPKLSTHHPLRYFKIMEIVVIYTSKWLLPILPYNNLPSGLNIISARTY